MVLGHTLVAHLCSVYFMDCMDDNLWTELIFMNRIDLIAKMAQMFVNYTD